MFQYHFFILHAQYSKKQNNFFLFIIKIYVKFQHSILSVTV